MRKGLPAWVLVITAALAVTSFSIPYANYVWSLSLLRPATSTDPDPVYASGPVLEAFEPPYVWLDPLHMTYGLFEGLVAGALSIGVYAGLARFLVGPTHAETFCRRCRRPLRGLVEPRCAHCGERL